MRSPKIGRLLAADEATRPLVDKARQIETLARLCAEFLPAGLASQVRAANLRDGELILLASNPPAAAKLKLLADSLRKFLLRQGSKVSLVSVRVQPRTAHAVVPPTQKHAVLTAGGISELSALYDSLASDSPARLALGRLLGRQDPKPPPAVVPRTRAAGRGRRTPGRP